MNNDKFKSQLKGIILSENTNELISIREDIEEIYTRLNVVFEAIYGNNHMAELEYLDLFNRIQACLTEETFRQAIQDKVRSKYSTEATDNVNENPKTYDK